MTTEFPPDRRIETLTFEEFERAARRGMVGPAEPHLAADYRALTGQPFSRIPRQKMGRANPGERLRAADVGMNLGYRLEDIARHQVQYEACRLHMQDMTAVLDELSRMIHLESAPLSPTGRLIRETYDALQREAAYAQPVKSLSAKKVHDSDRWRQDYPEIWSAVA
jgi:hypothetical protein